MRVRGVVCVITVPSHFFLVNSYAWRRDRNKKKATYNATEDLADANAVLVLWSALLLRVPVNAAARSCMYATSVRCFFVRSD